MSVFNELPNMDKPYDKFKKYGPASLSDSDLLAVFIRTGTTDKTPMDIAREIMTSNGNADLVSLCSMRYEDFISFDGIGEVKSIQLCCLTELSKRMARQKAKSSLNLKSPASIADYYMEYLRHIDHEEVWVCTFDSKCSLLEDCCISRGTINASMISPREIYRYALAKNAAFIVLVHNHPSGDPTPSAEDINVTDNICKAGEIVGIRLLDHIIIGDMNYTSLRDIGIVK